MGVQQPDPLVAMRGGRVMYRFRQEAGSVGFVKIERIDWAAA